MAVSRVDRWASSRHPGRRLRDGLIAPAWFQRVVEQTALVDDEDRLVRAPAQLSDEAVAARCATVVLHVVVRRQSLEGSSEQAAVMDGHGCVSERRTRGCCPKSDCFRARTARSWPARHARESDTPRMHRNVFGPDWRRSTATVCRSGRPTAAGERHGRHSANRRSEGSESGAVPMPAPPGVSVVGEPAACSPGGRRRRSRRRPRRCSRRCRCRRGPALQRGRHRRSHCPRHRRRCGAPG